MKEIEFLKFIISQLVNNQEDIIIERKEDELGVLLTLRVNKEDMGSIIGKNGNIVSSIRTLLKILGSKTGKRINLKVLD
ncbi:MAG: KH domain-containing protein [Candidatus Gracilibacteria bacterium]|nr:KH domain-containing protein [Candidatus Gracilibacteria bacterium]